MRGVSGSSGRATRALRLLLLLVLALAAVEYLFGGILESSMLKTRLYMPIYNATQPSIRIANKSGTWHKPTTENSTTPSHTKNVTILTKYYITFNATENKSEILTPRLNNSGEMTVQSVKSASPVYVETSQFVKKLMDAIMNCATTEYRHEEVKKTEPTPSLCPKMPPDLGPVQVNKTELELDFVEKKYPEIQWGGRYAPPNCTARHKVAIIVPYRDRQQHLAVFLNHMHPFLMKQQIEYGIFIIEQDDDKDFNRAKLMNVGFVESQRLDRVWECFVFHDVDLLPLDTRNLYTCPRQPRHMSVNVDVHKFKLPYEEIFGGVSAVTREQFKRVNGYSNRYWGWGGEDDDMYYRLNKVNYHVARYKMPIGRYAMLYHNRTGPNPKRYKLYTQTSKKFQNGTEGWNQDGLSTLKYKLDKVVQYHLYTYILANITGASSGMHSKDFGWMGYLLLNTVYFNLINKEY